MNYKVLFLNGRYVVMNNYDSRIFYDTHIKSKAVKMAKELHVQDINEKKFKNDLQL